MTENQQTETTARIWHDLRGRLRQFVQSRVSSATDVDDVLQTVFLRIHQKLPDLRRADRLESWVFQITRNAITDYFRKKNATTDEVDTFVDASNPSTQSNAEAELAGCMTALVARLPEDQRRALSMYEFAGISQKEIAARESISVSGAKSRIQRGRKGLESMLRACCEFELDRRGNVLEYKPLETSCCSDRCDGVADHDGPTGT